MEAIKRILRARHTSDFYWRMAKRRLDDRLDDFRGASSASSEKIVNQREIRLVGLKRSGNHAIVDWLRQQLSGKVIHLNNLRLSEKPYQMAYEEAIAARKQFYGLERYLAEQYGEGVREQLRQEALGNFIPKDHLLYSYEDYDLAAIASARNQRNHDRYFGKSDRCDDLLILRDLFNLLASRWQKGYTSVRSLRRSIIDLWLEYAREYLGETNYLKPTKIAANYNQWADDLDYRRQLAAALNLQFDENAGQNISRFGGGSSFDGKKFAQNANQMAVLQRWQHFADDRAYRRALSREDVFAYSERIFGHIPGTEILRPRG